MQQNINRKTIVVLLLAGAFIAILNQTTMITAIPPIMEEMGVTANTGQWLTTVFMLVSGIMIPVSAFLLERFSTRQLFLTAMSVFAFGTIVCALAPNFSVLLVGRVIQSAGAGVMLPLMQTVFLLIFPVHKRGSVMGLVGLVMSFAPAMGPVISGWLIEHFSWRVSFYIILPIAIIDIIIAFFVMKNVTELKKPKLDIPSIILSSFGFGGLLYGFTSAGNNGWLATMTIVTLLVGAVSLTLFIFRQLKLHHPMLEFRVFTYSIFPLAIAIGGISFMGLIGIETLIPLYVQNMRDFTALDAGLVLLPGALISGLMSPITGRIFDRYGAKILVVIGLAIMVLSTIPFSMLDASTSLGFMAVLFGLRMFGFSMVMMPIATAALNQLPNSLIPHGAAMDNTMRQISASVGTAILVSVMTTTGERAANTDIANPAIHGVNVAFMVIAALTIVALIISFFVKEDRMPAEEVERTAGTGTASQ